MALWPRFPQNPSNISMTRVNFFPTLCAAGFLAVAFSADLFAGDALPVEIPATDPNLHYLGRWDWQDAGAPRSAWSASRVMIKFQGTALNAKIREDGKDFWQVIIDGQPAAVIEALPGEQLYRVADKLPPGEHLVELLKRTEAHVGTTQITGFQANAGASTSPVKPLARKMEVIGDSISCGYGNESASEHEKFSPPLENANLSYGAIAAQKLGAEYVCVAWSGKKLWPDNTIPEIYDDVLPQDPAAAKWNFSKWKPDAVVINLGTNDFLKGNPAEDGWVDAYKKFIGRVRGNYPDARIYCAIGTIMSDSYPVGNNALSTIRRYIARVVAELEAAGETKVSVIDFGVQDARKNGLGAVWHPSVKTHEAMAGQLAETLKKDLGW